MTLLFKGVFKMSIGIFKMNIGCIQNEYRNITR